MKNIFLLLMLACSCPALSQDAKAPAGAEKAAPAKPPAVDERIAALAAARDPFWPPGYKPGGSAPVLSEEPTDDLDLLALRAGAKLNPQGRIKVGNKYLLMIKGRAVGQGDIIDVTGKNGKTFKMKIIAISQDNIQLEPVGH